MSSNRLHNGASSSEIFPTVPRLDPVRQAPAKSLARISVRGRGRKGVASCRTFHFWVRQFAAQRGIGTFWPLES